jgi:hypothetical protein
MSASQQHGFDFQKIIENQVFGLTNLEQSYTAIHDIPKERNNLNPNENVSIKVTGTNSIGMGDPLRIYDYPSTEKHTALVIYYQQIGDRKVVKRTTEFSLDDKTSLFGDIKREEIENLVHQIKSVPVGIPIGELNSHRKRINNITKEISKRSAIKFNSKIDSKNQRRLQCTITSIPPSILLHSEDSAIFRGIQFTDHVVSGTRIRHRNI